MKVVALELGFDNVALRQPGDEFELPEELVLQGGPAWFEPVDAADKAKFEAARKAYRKPQVHAVNPGKQAAEHEASVKELAKAQAENDALRAELAALKAKQK